MHNIKEQIKDLLSKSLNLSNIKIDTPPNSELGDFSLHLYKLAKESGKTPQEIKEIIKTTLKNLKIINKISEIGQYVNLHIDKKELAKNTLLSIWEQRERYGSSNIGKNKRVLIEHTSINPNASPHVGRARNAIIGDSISKLFAFQGYEVERHYWVNDVGKQVAMLVLGCKGKKLTLNALLNIYVDINQKINNNPKLEKSVLEILRKLEQGDEDVKREFRRVVEICVKGQKRILSMLRIEYDYFDYESKYLWSDEINNILAKLEKTDRLFIDEEGRYVLNEEGFDLAMKSPVLVLTRADKTSLYTLRDILYTIEKIEKGYDRNIIVLGEDQKLYFQQIKIALSLLGYSAPDVVHYSFVLLHENSAIEGNVVKMSTREGNVVLLEDFMNETLKKAKDEILKRTNNSVRDISKRARAIANSAVKYAILRVSPEKNVIFNMDRAISFEGDTGPYMLYSYARISSILKKYKNKSIQNIDFNLLTNRFETCLIIQLAEFPNIIDKSINSLRPHIIANYVYLLSQRFNEFYQNCPVLSAEPNTMKARIFLIWCVRQTLNNGLALLGIDTIEKM